jgi:hypothetical protein
VHKDGTVYPFEILINAVEFLVLHRPQLFMHELDLVGTAGLLNSRPHSGVINLAK